MELESTIYGNSKNAWSGYDPLSSRVETYVEKRLMPYNFHALFYSSRIQRPLIAQLSNATIENGTLPTLVNFEELAVLPLTPKAKLIIAKFFPASDLNSNLSLPILTSLVFESTHIA